LDVVDYPIVVDLKVGEGTHLAMPLGNLFQKIIKPASQ